jgi:hypothetical protein
MLVGHVATALVAKGLKPGLSLGAAVGAALLADVLLYLFVLGGIEHVDFRSSAMPGEYFTGGDITWSHSLAMTLVWAAAVAAAYRLLQRHRDAGAVAVIAVLAVSHWLLDVISHRPVMPLAPGFIGYVGWTAISGIVPLMVIEGVTWAAAVALYVADSRSVTSAGRYVFWGGIAALTYVWYFNAFLPPRIPPAQAPIEALFLLALAIAWAYWMNHAREMKDEGRRT